MDDVKWERYAALGGFAFVVLNIVGTFAAGSPPTTSDSAAKIAKYYSDHATGVELTTVLGGLGIVGLLWWLGSLWRLMVKVEGDRPRLAVVAVAGLAMGAALALASASVSSAIALEGKDAAGDAHLFFVLSTVLIAAAGFGVLAHIAAVTSLSYRTHLFAMWLNVVGWLAALGFLIASLSAMTTSSAVQLTGLAGFLLWCVWIIAISIHLWRRAPETRPV